MEARLEDRFFIIGMWWRIAYGVLRIILGLALLKVVGMPLVDVVTAIMGHELAEDPNDILYTLAQEILGRQSFYISYFLASYFIFWGIIDVFFSYNLIKHKMWAFPASMVFIGSFIFYELVRFTHTHSIVLLLIICADIVILWLVWKEFQRLQNSVVSYNVNEHV